MYVQVWCGPGGRARLRNRSPALFTGFWALTGGHAAPGCFCIIVACVRGVCWCAVRVKPLVLHTDHLVAQYVQRFAKSTHPLSKSDGAPPVRNINRCRA